MQRAVTFLFCLCVGLTLAAQAISAPQGCGYDHYVHALEAAYPGFRTSFEQVLRRNTPLDASRNLTTYTIPVVVHIVWQEESQNLSDEQINDVIDVLNEDFRRLNADAAQTRAVFADVVGDPGIEFELVAVERVETEATFSLNILAGTLPDNVKQSSEGGSDAWDTESYLNIWVCNINGGSLLGYAYPPADLANWPDGASAPSPELDGVVIHQEVFRRTGTYTATGLLGLGETTVPVRGRTITHEIGHYLGLRHIWGDGLLSILGIPDCSVDDGMDDTPNQGMSSQFACDTNQNSCTDDTDDRPDMFENYMDYAAEDCLNSFTNQQIAVMRGVLENERSGLLNTMVGTVTPNALARRFEVFPNPAQAELTIRALEQTAQPFRVQLFDVRGQRLLDEAAVIGQQTLSVTHLPQGLYILLVQQGQEQVAQRIVVQ